MSASWIVFGIFAVLPTVVLAIAGSYGRPGPGAHFPFVGFVLGILAIGVLLRGAQGADLLPFADA